MNSQKLMIATLAGVLMTAGALASGITPSARGQTTMNSTAVVRDSSTVVRWQNYSSNGLHTSV